MAKEKRKEFKKSQNPRSKLALTVILFLFFYALLYAFSFFSFLNNVPVINLIFPFGAWDSPMYFLMPVAGYFLVFFSIPWFNREFSTELAAKWVFPVVYFFLSLIAFYVNLFMYLVGSVAGREIIVCLFDCEAIKQAIIKAGTVQQYVVMDYWPTLKSSAFLPFFFAGIFAWLTIFILNKLEEKGFF